MGVQLVFELQDVRGAETILQALEQYKLRLRASIERTRSNLLRFETRYGVSTAFMLNNMAAEDLQAGDMEYVEWAGEAKLLRGLETELDELEHAHYQFS